MALLLAAEPLHEALVETVGCPAAAAAVVVIAAGCHSDGIGMAGQSVSCCGSAGWCGQQQMAMGHLGRRRVESQQSGNLMAQGSRMAVDDRRQKVERRRR